MSDRQVMIITGSSKGVGAFLSQYYSSRNYQVIGCSRSTVVFNLQNYEHYEVDVSNQKDVRHFISSVNRNYNRIDVLINNAGLASMNHVLLTPLETADKIMRTNFLGTFLFSRETAKVMQRRQFGRIVNISTVAVPLKLAGEAIYAASKGAIETFTRVIAKELAPFGVTCNAVGPAPIKTDLIKGVPEEKIDSIIEDLAIKRYCEYRDVANVIDFFIRPESDYVTGQVIYLGGA